MLRIPHLGDHSTFPSVQIKNLKKNEKTKKKKKEEQINTYDQDYLCCWISFNPNIKYVSLCTLQFATAQQKQINDIFPKTASN